MTGHKIVEGLNDAIAFAGGDESRGRIIRRGPTVRERYVADGRMADQTFRRWLDELDALPGEPYGAGKTSENTGEECWRGYYDTAYSPKDAMSEDQSYD